MQKRGLSNLVTTVLIVFVSLVAVGVIAFMISPIFQSSGSRIQAQSKCYEITVEPQRCIVYYGQGQDGGDKVVVTAGVTAGVAEGLAATVEYGDSTFESAQITDTTVNTFETRLIETFPANPSGAYAVRARAAAIVKTSTGEDFVCDESEVSVMCGDSQRGTDGICETDADCGADELRCIDSICTFFDDQSCTTDADCTSGYACSSYGYCVTSGSPGGGGGSSGGSSSDCEDGDGDGFASFSCGGNDCNDGDVDIHPGAAEICDNGIDDDCDGYTDEEDSECQTCIDLDLDGYDSCEIGESEDDGKAIDCDDYSGQVHPDATEICDLKDNDCDGTVDESSECTSDTACDTPGVRQCSVGNINPSLWKVYSPGSTSCSADQECYIIYGPTCGSTMDAEGCNLGGCAEGGEYIIALGQNSCRVQLDNYDSFCCAASDGEK
jgi:hypothetical protein